MIAMVSVPARPVNCGRDARQRRPAGRAARRLARERAPCPGNGRFQPVTRRSSARPMMRTLSRSAKRATLALITPAVKRVRLL